VVYGISRVTNGGYWDAGLQGWLLGRMGRGVWHPENG
jgi:hypothetical protein